MKVSLIIPIYNEVSHLKSFLEKLDIVQLGVEKELVLVDDCSRDGSGAVLESFPFQSEVKKKLLTINGGKGAAIRAGLELATGSIITIQDADFEYDMRDLSKLIALIVTDEADVVYGTRFSRGNPQVHRTFHYLGNRLLTLFSNLLSGLYLSDMETCYKVFRSEILKNIYLESNRFGFEPEVTAKIAKLKACIQEWPIRYFPRNYMEGKKINWKDGVAALWHIVKFNLLRDRKASFKVGLPGHYLPEGRQWL
jgi:glycosyltransferase involved in cell wall biosynthesis